MEAYKSSKICPLTLWRVGGLPFSDIQKWRKSWVKPLEKIAVLEENIPKLKEAVLQSLTQILQDLPEGNARTKIYNIRKDLFQHGKWHFNKVCDAIHDLGNVELHRFWSHHRCWMDALMEHDKLSQQIEKQWFRKLQRNFLQLKTLALTSEHFQKSLLFSSSELLQNLQRTAHEQPHFSQKKDRQMAVSLWQFVSRAVAKTSPFSRWTAVKFCENSPAPSVFFEENSSHLVPNVAILEVLLQIFQAHPTIFRQFSVQPNPSIIEQGGRYHFVFFDGEKESLQQLAANTILQAIFSYLIENQRVVSFENIKRWLSNNTDENEEACENYLLELIATGFLEWRLPADGWSAGWSQQLVQFLQWLPAEPVVSDVIFMLRTLPATARSLPFQNVEAASQALQLARETVSSTLQKHAPDTFSMPRFSSEQIFYEDFEAPRCPDLPAEALQTFVEDLSNYLKNNNLQVESDWQAAARCFWESQSWTEPQPFLLFAEKLLHWKKTNPTFEKKWLPRRASKIGVLLQPFQTARGEWSAVVNAVFSGGGKMFQRWLHFDKKYAATLKNWVETANDGKIRAHFSWKNWHNANFFVPIHEHFLEVPGGRSVSFFGKKILLSELKVGQLATGEMALFFENQQVVLIDTGLEGLAQLPSVGQLLWHLGVEQVDLNVPAGNERMTERSLVLRRRNWQFSSSEWSSWLPKWGEHFQFFRKIEAVRRQHAMPQVCFFQIEGKPQLLDFQLPVSIFHFEKTLRNSAGQLFISECLPAPQQFLEGRVSEVVMELELPDEG